MFSIDWFTLLSSSSADGAVPIAAAGCVLAWVGRKLMQTRRPGGRALGDALATGLLTAVTLHTLLH